MDPHGPRKDARGVTPARQGPDPARLVARPPVIADHHPDEPRNPLLLSNELPPAERSPTHTGFLSHHVIPPPGAGTASEGVNDFETTLFCI